MATRTLVYAVLIRSCGVLLLLAGLLLTVDWAASTTIECHRFSGPQTCTVIRKDLLETSTTIIPIHDIDHAVMDYTHERSYTLQFVLTGGQSIDLFTTRSRATQASNASQLNNFLSRPNEHDVKVANDNTTHAILVGVGWTLFSLLFIVIPIRYFIPSEHGGSAMWQ
jgi:hypothetical protein